MTSSTISEKTSRTRVQKAELLVYGYFRLSRFSMPSCISEICVKFFLVPFHFELNEQNKNNCTVTNDGLTLEVARNQWTIVRFGDYMKIENNDRVCYSFTMDSVRMSHAGIGFVNDEFSGWFLSSWKWGEKNAIFQYNNGYYISSPAFDAEMRHSSQALFVNGLENFYVTNDVLEVSIDMVARVGTIKNLTNGKSVAFDGLPNNVAVAFHFGSYVSRVTCTEQYFLC